MSVSGPGVRRKVQQITGLSVALGALMAAGAQAGDTLRIPIRWCALEGSPAVETPECACEANHRDVLWRRHERTTDAVWGPLCDVTFRSGAMAQQPTFPVIEDPCPPPDCVGQLGDILGQVVDQPNLGEFKLVINACAEAWDAMGVASAGLVGVNVRQIVDQNGDVSSFAGFGETVDFGNFAEIQGGGFVVSDNDFYLPPGIQLQTLATGEECAVPGDEPCFFSTFVDDPTDRLTGHEAGHALSLGHEGDTLMDSKLFQATDVLGTGGPGQNAVVCPPDPNNPPPTSQCGQARLHALCHVTGTDVDPPPTVDDIVLTPCEPDVPPPSDLAWVGLIDDENRDTGSFFWKASGLFEIDSNLMYGFALDLDRDPATGGSARDAGVNLPLAGVELAGRIRVRVDLDPASGERRIRHRAELWDLAGGAPVPRTVLDSEVRERDVWVLPWEEVDPGFDDRVPFVAYASLAFDRALLHVGDPPVRPDVIRAQAIALDRRTGIRDVSDPEDLYLIPPALPVCTLEPARALPGDRVTVQASDLAPNQRAHVLLGDELVAGAATDAAGHVLATFQVPLDTPPGTRLVSIGVADPENAITADCSLAVELSRAGR